MKTSSSITLIPVVALTFACTAMAQTPSETIRPAIIPSGQASVKAEASSVAPESPSKSQPVHTGVVVNPTPVKPTASAPNATVFSENSVPKRDETVHYYLPVGAISPQSGIRTYPGNTAARLTNGATRASSGIPAGSTYAKPAGTRSQGATKARIVSTR